MLVLGTEYSWSALSATLKSAGRSSTGECGSGADSAVSVRFRPEAARGLAGISAKSEPVN